MLQLSVFVAHSYCLSYQKALQTLLTACPCVKKSWLASVKILVFISNAVSQSRFFFYFFHVRSRTKATELMCWTVNILCTHYVAYVGTLFYVTNVTGYFLLACLTYKTWRTLCLLDVTCVCEQKENVSSLDTVSKSIISTAECWTKMCECQLTVSKNSGEHCASSCHTK